MKLLRTWTVVILLALTTTFISSAATLDLPFDLTENITVAQIIYRVGNRTFNYIDVDYPISFVANLSETDLIVWDSSAPNGGRYVVLPPSTGTNTVIADFNYLSGNSVGPDASTGPFSFEFLGLQGTAPTPSFSDVIFRQGGEQICASTSFVVDGSFSFTGIRLAIEGPASVIEEVEKAWVRSATRLGGWLETL